MTPLSRAHKPDIISPQDCPQTLQDGGMFSLPHVQIDSSLPYRPLPPPVPNRKLPNDPTERRRKTWWGKNLALVYWGGGFFLYQMLCLYLPPQPPPTPPNTDPQGGQVGIVSGWHLSSPSTSLGPRFESHQGALCRLGFQSFPTAWVFPGIIVRGFPPTFKSETSPLGFWLFQGLSSDFWDFLASQPGPYIIELLKQKFMLSYFLLSRNKQETSHRLVWLVTLFW